MDYNLQRCLRAWHFSPSQSQDIPVVGHSEISPGTVWRVIKEIIS